MIRIEQGDITKLSVDAIVNAANQVMLGGGGVYGYPIRDAAEIAVREVKAMLADHPDLEVVFCCFSAGDKAVYESLLNLSQG